MTHVQNKRTGFASSESGSPFWRGKGAYLGVLPFLIFSSLFLLYPTYSVATGAFKDQDNNWSTKVLLEVFHSDAQRSAFINSIKISATTALLGAVLGALFAWAVSVGKPDGIFRRISLAAAGVFALFGGVMLTFAFLATFGFNGLLSTLAMKYWPAIFIASPDWLYGVTGLSVLYLFFQIPLMFLVFLPTIENLRPQWREASISLGGSTFEYWRRIGIPILTPSFLGACLLLFANSFSAYATAASLISSGTFITPLQIADALSNEIGGVNPPVAKSLSLYMVIVVIIVMTAYALLRRRVSKWER